jgi:hypothetical protein
VRGTFRQGRADTAGRGGGGAREAAVGRSGRGCRSTRGERRESAVGTRRHPDSALSRTVGAVRGGHEGAARFRAGPVRRVTADPLVSDFRIKIYPEGN